MPPIVTIKGTYLFHEFLYCRLHGGLTLHVILRTDDGVKGVCVFGYDTDGAGHFWDQPLPEGYVPPIRQLLGLGPA